MFQKTKLNTLTGVTETTPTTETKTANHPSFGEAFRFWLKLGFISLGGPTGQIAIMHIELVERSDVDVGGCSFYRNLFSSYSVPTDHHKCRTHWIVRWQVETR